MKQSQAKTHIFVNTFARLHLGFLDLNGSQGRRFGSLGIGLNAPDTYIELALGRDVFGEAATPTYVNKAKQLILQHAQITQDVSIKVHREIPRHFGLGSGTQMALAVGEGLNQLFNLSLTPRDIAAITNRGARSGIGIGTFANGGVVLDAGHEDKAPKDGITVPPIIEQHPFPAQWRILLIFDHEHIGVHGDAETNAFASLQDADLNATQKVSEQVLTQALPAIVQENLQQFGEAVAALQAYTGDYFAPVQGGRYASARVAQVLDDLTAQGVSCVGQSSWGPTGFAVFESEAAAKTHLTALQAQFKQDALGWLLCEPRNNGAVINSE